MNSKAGPSAIALAILLTACGGEIEVEVDPALGGDGLRQASSTQGCSTTAGTGCAVVQSLLAERSGFGRRTVGGVGGRVYWVTNSNDSGPGSLRAALESSEKLWIRFARNVSIKLRDRIRVRSHKTVDGRGRSVALSGDGLLLLGARHVIVSDITLRDGKVDAIGIKGGASHIWVHHCDLSNYEDGLIDITRDSSAVTVSWNRLHDHDKGMVIGLQREHCDDSHQFVTVHHNLFDRVRQRAPRVAQSWVHHYNNVHLAWSIYAVSVSELGEVYAEQNYFEAAGQKTTFRFDLDSGEGYLRSVGNVFRNGARPDDNSPGKVGEPSRYYSYRADRAGSALRDRVRAKVGPRS